MQNDVTTLIPYIILNNEKPLDPSTPTYLSICRYFESDRFNNIVGSKIVDTQLLTQLSEHLTGWLRNQSYTIAELKWAKKCTAQVTQFQMIPTLEKNDVCYTVTVNIDYE